MSGGNPRSAAWYRTQYTDKSVRRTVVAADVDAQHANVIVPKSSKHTVYIQRILMAVTTDAAQTITFQDDSGAPVVGKSKASPGLGLHVVADHGAEGMPLGEGESLDMIFSAAGPAGIVTIEAYEKLTGTRSYLDGASVQ